jgi:S1-C subfamily serine protease
MKRAVFVVIFLACVFAVPGAFAQGQTPSSSNQQIWCYVEAERLLSRKWPSDCKGKIVSDDEAKEIRQERARRVAGSIRAKPLFADKRQIGSGSGMFVSADGHVLTNNHVIARCDAFSVTPAADGKAVVAQLVAGNAPQDLALLKTEPAGHAVARFRESEPAPATDIAVVGYPLLGRVVIKPMFVEGSVYAGAPSPSPERFMINMDVRHGNSGGPTIDRGGSVIGIVVAKINTPAVYANTGKAIYELGYSIRSQVALAFLRANGVSPSIATGPVNELDREPLLALATRYVAQIGCWK